MLVNLLLDNHTSDVSQDMKNHFRQASGNLHEILKHPGAWDPFILSYVEVGAYVLALVKLYIESHIGGVFFS